MMTRSRTCLTVDVEVFGVHWTAIGLIVAEYPSGKVLDFMETACSRHEERVSTPKKRFWSRNRRAKLHIQRLGCARSVEAEEQKVCDFVWRWLEARPTLFLISDNPIFDIKILQDITMRQRPCRDILIRNGNYFQPVCTWSMKLAVQMIKADARNTSSKPYDSRVWVPHCGIPHTPLYDCVHIMNMYFGILDEIFNLQDFFVGGQPRK
jgi:hypothetical protein